MKALIIGAGGYIGAPLVEACHFRGWETIAWNRSHWDFLAPPPSPPFPLVDVIYICAAMTRFIDCESNHHSYHINVDIPVAIATRCMELGIQPIFLSSEAVEKALHTNYGMQKALAEMGIRSIPNAVIARLSKVNWDDMASCCGFLADLAGKPGGIYRWP